MEPPKKYPKRVVLEDEIRATEPTHVARVLKQISYQNFIEDLPQENAGIAAYAVELYSRESHVVCVPKRESLPPTPAVSPSPSFSKTPPTNRIEDSNQPRTIVRPPVPAGKKSPPKVGAVAKSGSSKAPIPLKTPAKSSVKAPPPPRPLPATPRSMTTSLIADRVSMLEKNPHVLKAILGRQSRHLTTSINYEREGPPVPHNRLEPLAVADAALSSIISLYRSIPRYNLAQLLLTSPQRAETRRSRPATSLLMRKDKKQHVSLQKHPFPALTYLVRSYQDYPLSKEVLIKQGSIQAAEIFPSIAEDRAVIIIRPTCLILEEIAKSRQLLSSDVITGVCFLYDISGKRRISEEFHFKIGVNTGTLVDHRFSTAVFTVGQSSLVSAEKNLFLVTRFHNTMNRMLVSWCAHSICSEFPSLTGVPSTAAVPLYKAEYGLDDNASGIALSHISRSAETIIMSGDGSFHFTIEVSQKMTRKISARLANSTLSNVRVDHTHASTNLMVEDFSMPPMPRFDVRNSLYIYLASVLTPYTPIGTTVRVWVGLAHLSNQHRTLSIPEIENAWSRALPCVFVPSEQPHFQNAESMCLVVTKDSVTMAQSMCRGLGPGNITCDCGEVKLQLPVPLTRSHRLIFKIIRLDHRGLETDIIGFACCRIFDEGLPILDGYHAIEIVVAPQAQQQLQAAPRGLTKKNSSPFLSSSEDSNVTPTLVFRTKLISTVYPQSDKVVNLIRTYASSSENSIEGLNVVSTSRGIISAFLALSHVENGADPLKATPHMMRAIHTARTVAQGIPLHGSSVKDLSFGATMVKAKIDAPSKTSLISQEESIVWFPLIFTSLLKRMLLECSTLKPDSVSKTSALPMNHPLVMSFRQMAVILKSQEEQKLLPKAEMKLVQDCYLDWVFVNEASVVPKGVTHAALYDAIMLAWIALLQHEPSLFDGLKASWEFLFELLHRSVVSHLSQGRALHVAVGLGFSPWSAQLLRTLITELTCKMWLEHKASPIINDCLAELIRALRCYVPGTQPLVKSLVEGYLDALHVFEVENSVQEVSLRKWEFIRGAIIPRQIGFPAGAASTTGKSIVDTMYVGLLASEISMVFDLDETGPLASSSAGSSAALEAVRLLEDVAVALLANVGVDAPPKKYLAHLFHLLRRILSKRSTLNSIDLSPVRSSASFPSGSSGLSMADAVSSFCVTCLNWLTVEEIDPFARRIFIDMQDTATITWSLQVFRNALESANSFVFSARCMKEMKSTAFTALLMILQHHQHRFLELSIPIILLLSALLAPIPQERHEQAESSCPELLASILATVSLVASQLSRAIFLRDSQLRSEASTFCSEILPRLFVLASFAKKSVGYAALNSIGELVRLNYENCSQSPRVFTIRALIVKTLSDIPISPPQDGSQIWLSADNFVALMNTAVTSPPLSIRTMPHELQSEMFLIMQDMKSLAANRMRISQRAGTIDSGLLAELYLDMLKVNRPSVEMRLSWIHSTISLHKRAGNHEECALCQLKVACIIAQYLVIVGKIDPALVFPKLEAINSKIVHEELVSVDSHSDFKEEIEFSTLSEMFTLEGFINSLGACAAFFGKCQQFSSSSILSSAILDVILMNGMSFKLELHSNLLASYARKLAMVEQAGASLLSKFFWVRFDGPCFGVLEHTTFIYRFRYSNPDSAAALTQADKEVALRESFTKYISDQFKHMEGRFVVKFASHIDDMFQIRQLKLSNHTETPRYRIAVTQVVPYVPLDKYLESLQDPEASSSPQRAASKLSRSAFATELKSEDANAHTQQVVFEIEEAFPGMKTRLRVTSTQTLRLSPSTRAQFALAQGLSVICEKVRHNVSAIIPVLRTIRSVLLPVQFHDSPAAIAEFHLQLNRTSSYSVSECTRLASLLFSLASVGDAALDYINAQAAKDASFQKNAAELTEVSDALHHLKSTILRISYREERERSEETSQEFIAILAALRRGDSTLISPAAASTIDFLRIRKRMASVEESSEAF